jgi:hypothetical protein
VSIFRDLIRDASIHAWIPIIAWLAENAGAIIHGGVGIKVTRARVRAAIDSHVKDAGLNDWVPMIARLARIDTTAIIHGGAGIVVCSRRTHAAAHYILAGAIIVGGTRIEVTRVPVFATLYDLTTWAHVGRLIALGIQSYME